MVSDFLTTLFRSILEKPIASDRYVVKYNISRNNFAYYINTNRPMSPNVADGLYKIVVDTIKDCPEKKESIMDYLSSFLAVKEKDLLSDCEIIRAAIAKFTTASTSKKKNRIRAVSYHDIQKMKLDLKDLVREAMQQDDEEIENLTQEHGGQLEQWVKLATECNETWRYIFDGNNKIIGVWTFDPLFDDDFKRAKDGKFFDSELNLNMIPVLVPGIYNIYFVEICLNHNYKGTLVFRLVLNSIVDVLEQLAHRDIFINEICTQAYTDDGERLCKSLGLKYHKPHIDCGNIYCGTIKDLLEQPFCRNFYTLKRLYSSKLINS